MFVRKKRHRSGHIGVLVVDKSKGKFREIKSFGVAQTDAEADALCLEANQWIRTYGGQQEIKLKSVISTVFFFAADFVTT